MFETILDLSTVTYLQTALTPRPLTLLHRGLPAAGCIPRDSCSVMPVDHYREKQLTRSPVVLNCCLISYGNDCVFSRLLCDSPNENLGNLMRAEDQCRSPENLKNWMK